MSDLADLFARQKYAVWVSCLKEPQLSLLYKYTCSRAVSGSMKENEIAPGASAAAGDCFIDGLLMDLLPLAEHITNLKLFPTYSYFRVYRRGDSLLNHTDREACEISVSLCLGFEAAGRWPIILDNTSTITPIDLNPGDALFYRGIECPHWREPLAGDRVAQAFLHYVDQNGPYAEWKYDKRPKIPFDRWRTPT